MAPRPGWRKIGRKKDPVVIDVVMYYYRYRNKQHTNESEGIEYDELW